MMQRFWDGKVNN